MEVAGDEFSVRWDDLSQLRGVQVYWHQVWVGWKRKQDSRAGGARVRSRNWLAATAAGRQGDGRIHPSALSSYRPRGRLESLEKPNHGP